MVVNKAAMVYALSEPGLEGTTDFILPVITNLMITKGDTKNELILTNGSFPRE